MNTIETLRKKSIQNLFNMSSFEKVWSDWKVDIKERIIDEDGEIDSEKILALGDSLALIFKGTGNGRSQSSVSAGGYVWEALVCWYLNLCLIGTNTVVIKFLNDLVPYPIRSSLVVNYGNFISNTESDLLAISFPEYDDFKEEISVSGCKEKFDELTRTYFSEIEMSVIQCKTNWNDNAQIPMLWDIVYSSDGFSDRNITLGKDMYSIKNLKKFNYSFVTVPTVKKEKIKVGSTCVKRVESLSGGNYWGYPTKSGVARSMKEYFNQNVPQATYNNMRSNLEEQIETFDENYSYFDL